MKQHPEVVRRDAELAPDGLRLALLEDLELDRAPLDVGQLPNTTADRATEPRVLERTVRVGAVPRLVVERGRIGRDGTDTPTARCRCLASEDAEEERPNLRAALEAGDDLEEGLPHRLDELVRIALDEPCAARGPREHVPMRGILTRDHAQIAAPERFDVVRV